MVEVVVLPENFAGRGGPSTTHRTHLLATAAVDVMVSQRETSTAQAAVSVSKSRAVRLNLA